jgi:hypothetical protein
MPCENAAADVAVSRVASVALRRNARYLIYGNSSVEYLQK